MESPMSRMATKPCVNCRQRKVRCDRGAPCRECVRFGKPCHYESTSYQDQNDGLQDRLERLERMLVAEREKPAVVEAPWHSPPSGEKTAVGHRADMVQLLGPLQRRKDPGSEMVENGLSIHVTSGFWAKLFEETDELHMLLCPNEDLGDSRSSYDFIFGTCARANTDSKRPSHPPIEHAEILCNIFFERVEPFIRVLHKASFRRDWHAFRLGKAPFPREFEALLFIIYALAVLLTPSAIVEHLFQQPRAQLLAGYRSAAEMALADIQFMRSRKLISFQALLYWTTFLYESGDLEAATSMVGLLNQIAIRLGLDKDPSRHGFSPFVAEMRKRSWNHLAYLNCKGSEIEGLDISMIDEQLSRPGLPQNANDDAWERWLHAQLSPPPGHNKGLSDMTFVILRQQLGRVMSILLQQIAQLTVQDSNIALEAVRKYIENEFIQYFDLNDPMQKLINTYVSLYLQRISLAIDIGHVKYGRESSDEFKNGILLRAVAILSQVQLTESEVGQYGWSWIFRANPEWHAIAAIYCHLTHRLEWFSQNEAEEGWRQAAIASLRHENAPEFSLAANPSWQIIVHFRKQAQDRLGYTPPVPESCLTTGVNLEHVDLDFNWNSLLDMDDFTTIDSFPADEESSMSMKST